MYSENACRLCLACTSENILIFSNKGCEMHLHDNITKFLSISVHSTDNLPKAICFYCLKQLELFHTFYLKVAEVQTSLKNINIEQNIKEDLIINDILSNQTNLKDKLRSANIDEQKNSNLLNKNNDFNEQSKSEFNDNTPEYNDYSESDSDINNCTDKKFSSICNHIVNNIDKVRIKEKKKNDYNKEDPDIYEFYNLECDICKEKPKFKTLGLLKEHYKTSHGVQGYVNCCRKKFFFLPQLRRHMKGHSQPDMYKCNICSTVCSTKWALGAHMDRMHIPLEQRPLQCLHCDQRFVRRAHLAQHEMSHYTADQKKFICDECGKAFPKQPNLDAHKKSTHSNERSYICDICAKAFKSRHQLANHHMTHDPDGVHRVQCHICGKWVKNKYVLIVHMKTHNGPVSCTQCNKIFANQVSVTNHIRWVHSKTIKLHPCPMCGKKFKGPKLLQDHISTHTGDLPYQCPHCPKRFASSGNFSAHRRKCASGLNSTEVLST